MSVRFARSGFNIIKDHNELINRGKRTHEELDAIVDEIEEARGGFASLNDRLLDIISRIGTGGGGNGGECVGTLSYIYYVYKCEEDGATNVRLDEGYFVKGRNELEVFRGGLRQSVDDDYIEVDDKEIQFFDPLWAGEIVVMRVRDRYGVANNLGFHSEYIITTEETKDFTVNYKFDREGKWLEVYLNGILQSPGEDFVILTTNSIRFMENVPKGSLVYFRIADKGMNEEPVIIQEKFVAEEGKTEYELSRFNYNPGKEELELYVMGIRYVKGIDYEEASPFSFKFLKPVPEGSIILACKENAGYAKSSHLHCYGIVPIGVVDGHNREFLLPHIPQEGSLLAYVGGIRQGLETYKIEGNKLTFNYPPPKGTDLFVDYVI